MSTKSDAEDARRGRAACDEMLRAFGRSSAAETDTLSAELEAAQGEARMWQKTAEQATAAIILFQAELEAARAEDEFCDCGHPWDNHGRSGCYQQGFITDNGMCPCEKSPAVRIRELVGILATARAEISALRAIIATDAEDAEKVVTGLERLADAGPERDTGPQRISHEQRT